MTINSNEESGVWSDESLGLGRNGGKVMRRHRNQDLGWKAC